MDYFTCKFISISIQNSFTEHAGVATSLLQTYPYLHHSKRQVHNNLLYVLGVNLISILAMIDKLKMITKSMDLRMTVSLTV